MIATMKANKITFDIYDDALANWHTLNERVKKIRTYRGLNSGPLICRARILASRNTGSQRSPDKSGQVKTLHSHMVSQATKC